MLSTLKTEPSSSHSAPRMPSKRRLGLDDLLEQKMNSGRKSPPILQQYRWELNNILIGKEEFIRKQRHSSLVIDPRRIDDDGVMAKFAQLYQQVSQLHTDPDEHVEHLNLISDIVKGSIILEWPRAVYGVHKSGHDEATEVDQAPLIHRARNVVKCRTSHPTMRIKVYALTAAAEQHRGHGGPQVMEAFFRCSLTKAQSGVVGEQCDSKNATIAGRMILTQREGTAAPKTSAFTGALVNSEGKLVASQAAPDTQSFDLITYCGEKRDTTIRSTSFKYENGVLCATFPEMGVTLNSMVDRRQLATRYAILNEVFIKIDSLIIEHAFQSLPFLIAITNDQTEPLLNSIIWSRMLDKEHYDGSEPQAPITYGILREAARQFVKSQISQARSLTDRELLHFQAMHFLPKVNKCRSEKEVEYLNNSLYLGTDEIGDMELAEPEMIPDIDKMREAKRRLKDRLLSQFVKDHYIIDKHDFMGETCVSILDGRSELRHTPWQWLFKATELILDVGHKLCPSPAIAEKKSTKTKKQLAAAEEYHTMMSLFNKGVVSFFSVFDTHAAFKQLRDDGEDVQDGGNVMLRFCDENAGHISFVFGLDHKERLVMGSIAGETLKDFKQGLSEALMDEEYPAKHGRLVRMNVNPDRQIEKLCSTIRKRSLFNTYQSLRQIDNKTPFPDEELTKRINPFSGTEIDRDKYKVPMFPSGIDSLGLSGLAMASNSPFSSPLILPSLPIQPQTTTIKKRGRKPGNQGQSSSAMTEPTMVFINDGLFPSFNSSSSSTPILGLTDGLLSGNGDGDVDMMQGIKSESHSPPAAASPKTTAASPFASLSGSKAAAAPAAAAAGPSSSAVSAMSEAGVAALLEQPIFQTMLSQIMTQTITQMLTGGDLSSIGAAEQEEMKPDTKPDVKPNRTRPRQQPAAAPQSLQDILRATEMNEESDQE